MKRLVLYAQPVLILLLLGVFSIFFFGGADVLPQAWPSYTGHPVYHRASDSFRAKPEAVVLLEEQEENEEEDDHHPYVSHLFCFLSDALLSAQFVRSLGVIATLSSSVAPDPPYLLFRVLRL